MFSVFREPARGLATDSQWRRGSKSTLAACPQVLLWLCLTLVAGVAPATDLRGPGKAAATDPAGDLLTTTGEPIDVVRYSAAQVGDQLQLRLELAAPISPADSGRADALFGFLDLDTDQRASTGELPVVDFLSDFESGIGSDLLIDLSTFRSEDGRMDLVAGGELLSRVPATFADRSLTLDLPLALVGGDGAVSTSAAVGNAKAVTDVVPNGGAVASTAAGDGEVVLGGRFAVEVSWRDFVGDSGMGTLVFQSEDSAVFWFFQAENWELMVKVIDGCAFNGHFWVFSAATTDVEFTLRVRDTQTDEEKVYVNALGTAAPAVTDTGAFPTCEGS